MKKIVKKMKSMGNERGVALVFTLAILSLLLVLGLSFVTDSLFEQKAAYNAANATSARFLAEAELKKVITLLKYYDSGIYYSRDIFPSEFKAYKSGSADRTFDNLDRLETKEGDSFVFEWQGDSSNHGFYDYINWNYITMNDGTNNRIVGRTAFVLIPDSGISPAALVKSSVDEAPDAATWPEVRIGREVNEVNIRSINTTDITAPIARIFNYTSQPDGKFDGTSWVDFSALFKAFDDANVPTASGLTDDLKNNFRKWFTLYAQDDKEAFWIDLNQDKIVQKNDPSAAGYELFERFNLGRCTDANSNGVYDTGETNLWDTATQTATEDFINETLLLDAGRNGSPDIALTKWTNATSGRDGTGISWLALWGLDSSGTPDTTLGATFGSDSSAVHARRRQIAANLKDYCDSDSIPSSDVDPSTWLTAVAPKYTGNEKTPYLNEIGVLVTGTAANNDLGDKSNASIKIDLMAEVINIYKGLDKTKSLSVTIKGEYTYYLRSDSTPSGSNDSLTHAVSTPWGGSFTKEIKFNDPAPANDWSSPKDYCSKIVSLKLDSSATDPAVHNCASGKKGGRIWINNVKVKLERAIVTYDGKVVDMANFNDDTGTHSLFDTYDLSSQPSTSLYVYASWQVADPRQNLNLADWTKTVTSTPNWTTGLVNSFAVAPNAAGTDKDVETVSDPAYDSTALTGLSTAVIANRPMISPWELGFIHRGKMWQTINLKAYDKDKAVKPIDISGNKYLAGGGAYATGDANILDQIKLTDNGYSKKKINVKSHMDEVYKALFNKVVLNCSLDSTVSESSLASGGTALDSSSDITVGGANLFSKIKEKNINFFTRSAIAEVSEMSTGSIANGSNNITRDTDAKQEELIGKTVNLTEVGGKIEYFTIIVIAQAIRDVGTPKSGSGVTVTKYDRSKPAQLQEITDCKLEQFDFNYTDQYDFKTYVYGDDIVGEQKIKVRGYRDGAGNVKILSYEYVD